jgi:WS/DGAT/MGAT family acyltransferase
MTPKVEALSALDSFFLYLESPRTPMHSGSVGIFEGAPLCDPHGRLRIEDVRAEVESRLHLVPKLRQRVQFSILGEAGPVWADDPEFDIAYHVRRAALPAPGSEVDLITLCAGLMEVPLDRERPLWEMWLVGGLEGGRVAVIEKLHHALADGLAGVELATVLLDVKRHPRPQRPAQPPWRPSPAPALLTMAARDVLRRGSVPLRATMSGLGSLRHPVRAAGEAARLADALSTVITPRSIAPRCSLNAQVGHGRRLAFVREPLDELERVERRFGVTLNDLLLTAVAGGLHRLLSERGEQVDGRNVQALVPVGTDHHGDHRLGNRVSAMLVRLPIGPAGPAARLWEVAREQTRCKRHHQPLAGELLVGMLDPWPQAALSAGSRLIHHQPFVNLVVTNVRGPGIPLYAMGARMLEAFPIVPLAGNLSVGVAALSYDRQLTVGVLADRNSCSDIAVFAEGIASSFAELIAASGSRHRGRFSAERTIGDIRIEDGPSEQGNRRPVQRDETAADAAGATIGGRG